MMAISAAAAWKMRVYCLSTQTHILSEELEEFFLHDITEDERECLRLEMGTDSLIRQFKSGKLTGEDVLNNSIEKEGGLSYLIPSCRIEGRSIDADLLAKILPLVYSAAEEKFETVMIDAGTGIDDSTIQILAEADVVAVVCCQGKKIVRRSIETLRDAGIAEEKLFFVFSRYIPTSRYNINNLKFFLGRLGTGNTGAVPLSTAFMDAIEEGRQYNFLKSLERNPRETEDPYFFKEIVNCVEKLIGMGRRIVRRR
ncbi:MAG: hypothetical protein K6G45_02430 [Lachnospiraceae bacterium]|nr:hypothetical protein [Lachnospiraceae bacterium]